ncbi:MAG: hypothetical protein U0791_26170 [Gemmataceae bacterium]
MRYLLQQEGWPLGYLSQVVGEPSSGKSALVAEVLRWHLGYPDGRALLLETEVKPADVPMGIIGWTPQFWLKRFQTLEQWARALSESIRVAIDQPPSTHHPCPHAFGVDTIWSALPEDRFRAMEEVGHSSGVKRLPAKLMESALEPVIERIGPMPFSVVAANHMKPKGRRGWGTNISYADRNVVGGSVINTFQAIEIQTIRLSEPRPGGGIRREEDDECGILLRLETVKNIFATPAVVLVELLWKRPGLSPDPYWPEGFFDWYAASIETLLDLSRGGTPTAKRLREIIPLRPDRDQRLVSSPIFGSEERIPYRTAGQILEQVIQGDKNFREALYSATGIRPRPLLKAVGSFAEQSKAAFQDYLSREPAKVQARGVVAVAGS